MYSRCSYTIYIYIYIVCDQIPHHIYIDFMSMLMKIWYQHHLFIEIHILDSPQWAQQQAVAVLTASKAQLLKPIARVTQPCNGLGPCSDAHGVSALSTQPSPGKPVVPFLQYINASLHWLVANGVPIHFSTIHLFRNRNWIGWKLPTYRSPLY